jgi:hypothetical protein
MTSTDHYLKAERLLKHAATMAAENVAPMTCPGSCSARRSP